MHDVRNKNHRQSILAPSNPAERLWMPKCGILMLLNVYFTIVTQDAHFRAVISPVMYRNIKL